MKSFIFAAMSVLFSVNALATESLSKSCTQAIVSAAYEQLSKDANIDLKKVDEMARIFDPYIDEEDDKGFTIDVSSQDIDAWNGYASYFVTVQESGNSCQVVSLKLKSSEGL